MSFPGSIYTTLGRWLLSSKRTQPDLYFRKITLAAFTLTLTGEEELETDETRSRWDLLVGC